MVRKFLKKIFINIIPSKYFLIISIIFIISLYLKFDYVGTLSEYHHQWGVGTVYLTVENWLKDGVSENNFLRVLIPQSIDRIYLQDRGIYISHPMGVEFLVYFVKLIFKSVETIKIIHLLNAFFHYLIVIFIYFFVKKIRFDLNNNTISAFAVIASISYLLLPLPFYYHLMLFSYDQSIILPFIIIIYLENLLRSNPKNKYFIIQSLIFFLSGFLDYFSIILASSILLFRIIFPIKNFNIFKNIIQIFVPLSVPFILQLYNLYENNYLQHLFERFLRRTGIIAKPYTVYDSVLYHFWFKKLHIYFPFILISILFLCNCFYRSKFKNSSYLVILIGFFSCIIYSLILSDLVAIHDFTALKFYPMLSISLFAIIPLKIIELQKIKKKSSLILNFLISFKINTLNKIKYLTIFLLFFLISADNILRYIYYSKFYKAEGFLYHDTIFKKIFFSQFPNPSLKDEKILRKINETSKYEDIYISFTDLFFSYHPPQKLSIAKKIVQKIKNENDLLVKIAGAPDKANIKIIIYENSKCKNEFKDNEAIYVDKKIILKVNKNEVQKMLRCL
jgi:hypothetical protein